MITALAVLFGSLAAALFAGGRSNLVTTRLTPPSVNPTRPMSAGRLASGWPVASVCTLSAAVVGAAIAGPGGAIAGVVAVPTALRWRNKRVAAQTRRRREKDVEDSCVALAAELSAGMPPRQALNAVADDWPNLFASASRRSEVGGEPTHELRASAEQPGAEALVTVAAAWEVSERTGAGLSVVLAAVADSLRAENAVRRESESQLASVRTTARLMAVLPVATLLVFSGGDGSAVDFLTRTPYGLACLVLAGAFVAAGLFWVDRTSTSLRSVWQT